MKRVNRRARKRIADGFMAQHAIGPEDAIDYRPAPEHAGEFERLRAHGILREFGRGRWWLDLAAYDAEDDTHRRKMVPVVIAVSVVLAGVLTLFYRG